MGGLAFLTGWTSQRLVHRSERAGMRSSTQPASLPGDAGCTSTQRIRTCASQGGNVLEGTRLEGTTPRHTGKVPGETKTLPPCYVLCSSLPPFPLFPSPPLLPSSSLLHPFPRPGFVPRHRFLLLYSRGPVGEYTRLQDSEVEVSREIGLVLGCDNRQS